MVWHWRQQLARSAAGAGLLIGSMALLKVLAAKVHVAPLPQAMLYSLNYAACKSEQRDILNK